MAAVGDHAERGAQPPGNFEGVAHGDLPVARAGQDERRAA